MSDRRNLSRAEEVRRRRNGIVLVEYVEDMLCARLEVGNRHGRPPFVVLTANTTVPARTA